MDVYKVSIALAMSSNHAAVLGALSSHLLGVNTRVTQLHNNFGRLKTVIGGAFAIGAGMALFGVMEKIVDKTKEYSDELVKLQRLGGAIGKAAESGDMSRRAFDISTRVPMKVTDLLKIPGASYSILGQDDSMKVWEQLAKFSYVMQSEHGYKGDPTADLGKFLRAGELGGRLTDPKTHQAAIEELQRFLDLSSKVMAATHGMVTPSTMLGMSQQAGFSMRGMTDEGFMNMAIMAQAMGGPRAGTALLSTYQQMGGGKMTRSAAQNMQDMGMLSPDDWHTDHGRVIVNADVQRRLGGLLSHNPMDLVDAMYANLEKRGVKDPVEQQRIIMGALSRQTGQRFINEQMMNREQMASERARMNGGMGSSSSFDLLMNKSVSANMEALSNSWNNMLTALAGPNSENVINFLKALTSVTQSLTGTINAAGAETISNIGKGLAVLTVALTTGGAAAILAALGPAGWLVVGLTAIAAAAAKWGPDLLKNIYSGLDYLADKLNSFFAWLKNIADKFGSFFGGGSNAPDPVDDLGRPIKKMSFSPGMGSNGANTISLSLNVDGRTLARVISENLEAGSRYETSPPAFNGAGMHV